MSEQLYWWERPKHGGTDEYICWDCVKVLKDWQVNRRGVVFSRKKAPRSFGQVLEQEKCTARIDGKRCGQRVRPRMAEEA